MQRLEVSCAVWPIYRSLGAKGLIVSKWLQFVSFLGVQSVEFALYLDMYLIHTGYSDEKMDSDFCQKYIVWNCLNYICISVSVLMYLIIFTI
jgi:hypothetical protein